MNQEQYGAVELIRDAMGMACGVIAGRTCFMSEDEELFRLYIHAIDYIVNPEEAERVAA